MWLVKKINYWLQWISVGEWDTISKCFSGSNVDGGQSIILPLIVHDFLFSLNISPFPCVWFAFSRQSPFGIPVLLRPTQTCLQDGWGCEIHLAHTTGTSPQAPPSGSLLHLWVKWATPWCLRPCPWRPRPARSLRWACCLDRNKCLVHIVSLILI